jgi:hypothetical protein
LDDVGQLTPGAAATALAGQESGTLLPPALALVVLAAYAGAVALAGTRATIDRDAP